VIAGLRGRLRRTGTDFAVLDVQGVSFQVHCTPQTLAGLEAGGDQEIEVVTRMIVREDEISLYGFRSPEEERLFAGLITVSGVGPKVALALLGRFSAQELALAIASGDTARLSQAAGVGKKLAARIALELQGRLQPEGVAGAAPAQGADEALMALLALGLPERTAVAALDGLSGPVEDKVRQALRKIGSRA